MARQQDKKTTRKSQMDVGSCKEFQESAPASNRDGGRGAGAASGVGAEAAVGAGGFGVGGGGIRSGGGGDRLTRLSFANQVKTRGR